MSDDNGLQTIGVYMTPQKTYRWTRIQYLAFHKRMAQKMIVITQQKNADYTGATNDPFANFRESHEFDGATKLNNAVELGFLTRMSDKWSRIKSFVTVGTLRVKDETVTDTILDFANYLILFAGYLEEKRMAKYLNGSRKLAAPVRRAAPVKKAQVAVAVAKKAATLKDGPAPKAPLSKSARKRISAIAPESTVTQ
jgi:hypothetical protein